MRRYLKLNQGMTMGMVLMIMSFLSILGVATLSLAVSAYRVQISDKNVKSTFYVADSELDQAYGFIGAQVKEAIKAGNQAVNYQVQQVIEYEKEKEIETAHDTTPYDSPWLNNDDGTLDEKYLATQLNDPNNSYNFIKTMQDAYIVNMKTYSNDLTNKLTDTSNTSKYKPIDGGSPYIFSIPGGITQFVDNDHTKNMVIPLQVQIKHQTGDQQVIQTVKADFNIKVPSQIVGYQTTSNSVYLQDQPLWRTALASYKDVNFSGDFSSPSQQGITVNGDVFAAGTIPSDLKNLPTFGGITAGKSTDNTKVTIKGNAYSNANVQVNSNNTNFTITKNVYSDNVVLQTLKNNSKIEVDNDAYTRDDLEINGNSANLWIKGKYNGYSIGNKGADKSSSIVINSSNINTPNGSSVKIDGGSFLYGTVYINSGDPDYETGESISIDGNYRAYGYLPDKAYYGNYDPQSNKNENNYTFSKVGNSLMLINFDQTLGTDPENMNHVFDKAEHFYDVYLDLVNKGITDFLNTGSNNPSSIVLGGEVLSTGSFINNGVVEKSTYNLEKVVNSESQCIADVDKNVTKPFGHTDASDNSAVYDLTDRVANISESPDRHPAANMSELVTSSHDVYIIGNGGDKSDIPSDPSITEIDVPPSVNNIGGLILTSSNVYIRGKVNFYGSIIAGGNITVEDNNDKNFYAEENLVKQIIAANNLNGLFNPPGNNPTLFNFDVGGGVPDPGTNPNNSLISIMNWKTGT